MNNDSLWTVLVLGFFIFVMAALTVIVALNISINAKMSKFQDQQQQWFNWEKANLVN